jgi:uncharacterized membrane protein (DUF373 family)
MQRKNPKKAISPFSLLAVLSIVVLSLDVYEYFSGHLSIAVFSTSIIAILFTLIIVPNYKPSEETPNFPIIIMFFIVFGILLFELHQYLIGNLSIAYFLIAFLLAIFTFSILLAWNQIATQITSATAKTLDVLRSGGDLSQGYQINKVTVQDLINDSRPTIKNLVDLLTSAILIFFIVSLLVYIYLSLLGQFPETSDETFFKLLEIVLSFIAIIGSGIYIWITRLLKNDVKKIGKEESSLTVVKTILTPPI